MYELQADPNVSPPSVPSLARPPAFSPPRYAIWVNSLWFLSLVISLTCAMLATLLQQWARRYIRATQLPRCSPEKRARIHAFFANGVKKFHADCVVEALPALIHLSLLTFFAGLLIFLDNVNHTVFSVVLCGVTLSSAVYLCITLMPIFWLDSPYYAPLSSTVWLLYAATWYSFWKLRAMIVWRFTRGPDYLTWYSFTEMKDRCRGWILGGLGRATEEVVSYLSSELDSCVVDRTVDALGEDDDLEKFFECLHGYYLSDYVNRVQRHQPPEVRKKIEAISSEFLQRTLSSELVSEIVALRRLASCLVAVDMVGGPFRVGSILQNIFFRDWNTVPHAVEIGHLLNNLDVGNHGKVTLEVRSIISSIISSVSNHEHDERLWSLTLNYLGVAEDVLEEYLAHGNSLHLATLNRLLHVIRQHPRPDWTPASALLGLSLIDMRNTLPRLQHEFCSLWNKFVEEAQSNGIYRQLLDILWPTRRTYIALHQGTDATPTAFSGSTFDLDQVLFNPSSYPLCNLPDHHPDPDPHVRTQDLTVPHHDPIPATTATPPTVPDTPSLPTSSNLGHSAPSPGEGSSPGDVISPVVTSSRRVLLAPSVDPVLSSDPAITIITQDAGERPTTSSTPTNPRSLLAAPTYILQQALTPSSHSTSSPQLNTGRRAISPLTTRGMSIPSSPPSLPPTSHTPSADLRPSATTSAPQSGQRHQSPSSLISPNHPFVPQPPPTVSNLIRREPIDSRSILSGQYIPPMTSPPVLMLRPPPNSLLAFPAGPSRPPAPVAAPAPAAHLIDREETSDPGPNVA